MTRRVLVIANETVGSDAVQELLETSGDEAEVLVVAPILGGRLDFWANDDRRSRRAAEERLSECVARLGDGGLDVQGIVGDADPLLAIEDALQLFAADTIVVVTHPRGRSHWLEKNVVARAERKFRQPVVQVVAQAYARAAA